MPLPMGEGGRRPGEGSVADRTALLGGLRLLATPSGCQTLRESGNRSRASQPVPVGRFSRVSVPP